MHDACGAPDFDRVARSNDLDMIVQECGYKLCRNSSTGANALRTKLHLAVQVKPSTALIETPAYFTPPCGLATVTPAGSYPTPPWRPTS